MRWTQSLAHHHRVVVSSLVLVGRRRFFDVVSSLCSWSLVDLLSASVRRGYRCLASSGLRCSCLARSYFESDTRLAEMLRACNRTAREPSTFRHVVVVNYSVFISARPSSALPSLSTLTLHCLDSAFTTYSQQNPKADLGYSVSAQDTTANRRRFLDVATSIALAFSHARRVLVGALTAIRPPPVDYPSAHNVPEERTHAASRTFPDVAPDLSVVV